MSRGAPWHRQRFEVPCTLDVEHSAASLHAHVTLDGIELGPGDEVLVHVALGHVRFGERRVVQALATVTRAPWWRRHFTAVCSYWHLCSLYEVSFSENRTL
jgi:hypothetical protein